MSGLVYVGSQADSPDHVITEAKIKSEIAKVPTLSQVQSEIKSQLSGLATTSYVDSVAGRLVNSADVGGAFSGKLKSSTLGQTVARLGSNGKFPTSYFSPKSTRGAQFFSWTGQGSAVESRDGWGSMQVASLNVSNAASPNKYMILAWGRLEVICSSTPQTPGACIELSLNGDRVGFGTTTANVTANHDTIDVMPTYYPYTLSGTTTLYISGIRAGTGAGNMLFSGYDTTISALTIPVP